MTPSTLHGALNGVKVLEFSRYLPGGLAGQMLGDLGADVVKIEHPAGGDPMRDFPLKRPGEDSGIFLIGNRNKRSLTLDLKQPEGSQLAMDLIAGADVVIEGFRPGVADRLGIGHVAAGERNPRLVYCAISGFGQDGPDRDRPGHDLNYLGSSGVLHMMGRAQTGIPVPGPFLADIAGGTMMALYGILAALLARTVSGKGQFVDVSMTDGMMQFLHPLAAEYLIFGQEHRSETHRTSGSAAAYNVYRCADGRFLTLGIIETHFWHRLRGLPGLQDLPDEPFPTADENRRAAQILTRAFLDGDRDMWLARLAAADIPAGPVNTFAEAFADPQLQARGMLQHVEHPALGSLPQIGFPVKFSETPGRMHRPPPLLGQHSDEILAGLGLDIDRIAHLRAAGTV